MCAYFSFYLKVNFSPRVNISLRTSFASSTLNVAIFQAASASIIVNYFMKLNNLLHALYAIITHSQTVSFFVSFFSLSQKMRKYLISVKQELHFRHNYLSTNFCKLVSTFIIKSVSKRDTRPATK